jgi:hypothetical protein
MLLGKSTSGVGLIWARKLPLCVSAICIKARRAAVTKEKWLSFLLALTLPKGFLERGVRGPAGCSNRRSYL